MMNSTSSIEVPLPKAESRTPDDTDRHVGSRVRQRRLMLGLTQQQLAEIVGQSYQQQHKRECGTNRISAGMLQRLATALGVEVGYFFEGLTGDVRSLSRRERSTIELAHSFANIQSRKHQDALLDLARALAGE